MKKEKSTNTIQPVFPTDYKIEEIRNEDGSITYQHPIGFGEVDVKVEELEMRFAVIMERFEDLTSLLSDYDDGGIGFIYSALVEHAQHQIHEIFHFLDKTVGVITCTTIEKNQSIYRWGRCIAISVEPCREEA